MNRKKEENLRITAQCGACMHLKKIAHAKISDGKSVCAKLGRVDKSPACRYFSPDLARYETDESETLANVLIEVGRTLKRHKIPEHLTGLVAYYVSNAPKLKHKTAAIRGQKLELAQPVYVNVLTGLPNESYLNTWFRAYVAGLGMEMDDSIVVYSALKSDDKDGVKGYNNNRWCTFTIPISSDSIMTLKEFQTLENELKAQGRVNIPKNERSGIGKLFNPREAGETRELAEVDESIFTKVRRSDATDLQAVDATVAAPDPELVETSDGNGTTISYSDHK